MKKKLVEVGNLDPYVCLDSKKFYAEEDMILTPGARDELSKRGISIVCAPKPEKYEATAYASAAACPTEGSEESAGLEKLVLAVAVMLKEEYGITDPKELHDLSCRFVNTIKENI